MPKTNMKLHCWIQGRNFNDEIHHIVRYERPEWLIKITDHCHRLNQNISNVFQQRHLIWSRGRHIKFYHKTLEANFVFVSFDMQLAPANHDTRNIFVCVVQSTSFYTTTCFWFRTMHIARQSQSINHFSNKILAMPMTIRRHFVQRRDNVSVYSVVIALHRCFCLSQSVYVLHPFLGFLFPETPFTVGQLKDSITTQITFSYSSLHPRCALVVVNTRRFLSN